MTTEGLGSLVQPERLGATPEGPSEEVLYHSAVLNGLASDIGRKHHAREGDYYITPAIQVDDDDLNVHAEVRIGYVHYESENTIFVVTPEGMKPWYRLGREGVTRGDGEVVDDLAERKRIRGLLGLTETALDQSVINALNEFDVSTPIDVKIAEDIAQLESRLAHLKALQTGVNQLPLKLAITLNSGWAREGEESPTTEYDGEVPFAEALQTAADNFKKINRRSDVQASPIVRLTRGEASYTVPPEVWLRYFQMICGSAGYFERSALRYVESGTLPKQPVRS